MWRWEGWFWARAGGRTGGWTAAPSDRGTPVSTSLREVGGSQVPWQGTRGSRKWLQTVAHLGVLREKGGI